MKKNIKNFIAEYSDFLLDIPYVSTMTFLVKTNYKVFSIGAINVNLEIKDPKPSKKRITTPFRNCKVVIVPGLGRNVTGKIFPNGLLQIAGCTTAAMGYKAATKICDKITSRYPIVIKSFALTMINMSFKINKSVLMDTAYTSFSATAEASSILEPWKQTNVRYDKDHHAGIIIKIHSIDKATIIEAKKDTTKKKPKKEKKPKDLVTAIVFKSGSVIITGISCANDFTLATGTVMTMLEKLEKNEGLVDAGVEAVAEDVDFDAFMGLLG
jgi:TATA-box binding protein (TBP) (component of TFIID and TFIIIB)